jgi:hypothetical protein
VREAKDLKFMKVFVVGGGYDYIKYFYGLGLNGSTTLEGADFVVFTGGEDVSPELYGEKNVNSFNNPGRDKQEKIVYEHVRSLGIPMVGICRGGQFLNVMNGGKMWQDVNNHCGDHKIKEVGKGKKARSFLVTSTHHQMMRPGKGAVVLAVGDNGDGRPICDLRETYGECVEGADPKEPDYEVLWYPETNCLCFQPHPEYASAPKDCRVYFEELLSTYVEPAMPLPKELQPRDNKIVMIDSARKESK